ncbi:unnamed protein product [Ectocarpus fasciculatus]
MRRLAGVALGGGGSEFPALLVGLVRASVHEMVGHKVSENRSAVAREACRCVAVLARCLTDHFGALAELWLPELLRNTTRAVVVAAAGDEAARAIFGCTKDGFPRLLPYLVDTAKNKSAAIRRRCLDYAMLALARWSDAAFDRYAVQLRDMVAAAVADADSSVRATARRAYWVLSLRFPDLAQSVMGSLAPSMQASRAHRHVLREDQEFDAEAFVRAADAAAEDPQPALGEHPEDLDGDNGSDIAGGGGATTPGSADLSASHSSRSNLQASSSSSGSAAAAATAAAVARRVHGTHHGGSSSSSSTSSGGGAHQFAQRRPASAAFDGEGGLAAAGGAARSSSARVKVDRGAAAAAAGGGGGSGRVLRPGGGAPARRARPPGRVAAAHDGMLDVAADSNAFSFGSGSAFDAVGGGGGGNGDGSKNRSASSALRVAGGGGGGSEGEAATMTMPATAKSGAFRVPRGGASEAMTRVPAAASGDALHQRSPATRVVARRSSVVPAAGGEGEPQGFGAPGAVGGVSKAGRGVQPARVVGRQQQQQQRLDASAAGRREEEAGESKADGGGAMRAVAAAPIVLDRRHVLRQMDDLADQAGVSHWGARTEALESMLHLLTVEGGGGGSSSDSGERGEGGKFVLESRPASRRLETVISERTRDANFRVVAAALKLFGGLVGAHPTLMSGHTSALLPSVFPTLADPKEPVRQAANEALNACRAAYNPNQLCSSLCPRVLELPAGRARTGLLEFLAVLVPHSAVFFLEGHHSSGGGAGGGGGHMQSLTQRVASALAQAPPPSNWDGSLGEDGPTSAGPAASAAIRLLTALSRLDRDALATASAALPPEPAAAVRRALSFLRPKSPSPSPSPPRRREVAAPSPTSVSESAAAAGGSAEAGGRRSPTTDGDGEEHAVAAVVSPAVGGARSVGRKPGDGDEGSLLLSPPLPSPLETPRPPLVAAASPAGDGGFALSSNPGTAFLCEEGSGGRGRPETESALFTPQEQRQQQQQQNPHRQPFAPRDSNGQPGGERRVGLISGETGKNKQLAGFPTPKKGLVVAAPASATRSPTVPAAAAAEAMVVGGRLIAGLSRGARSHRKIEALSLLPGLADGEGAGGRADFWPRYFGQVLMLLLEGAAMSPAAAAVVTGEESTRRGGGNGGRQGGVYSTPSRRRALLRAKHLQGVRCLVARRGGMFPGSTEMVVGRLVEIGGGGGGGGDPSLGVRCEAEACLADLVGVLDPARYLAVLTPLLALLPDAAAAAAAAAGDCENPSGDGGGPKEGLAEGARGVLAQCVALGALRALTPRLSSPGLLGALGAGPLLAGLEAALGGGDLEARKRAVLALVEMYQVLEEALLPFLANFPTNRLKLITMYIEQRRARDKLAAAAAAAAAGTEAATSPGFARVESGGSVAAVAATRFTPIR